MNLNKKEIIPTPPYRNNCHCECSEAIHFNSKYGLPRRLKNTLVDTPPQSSPSREEEQFQKYICAFTLAEVLITLVIIGVIAAITVPSLINKTQNQEYVSRLKKAYSTLAQATNQIIAEEGPATNWVTDANTIYNIYKKKLINIKECGISAGCFSQSKITFLNSNIDTNDWNTYGRNKFVLQDGTQIMIQNNITNSCNSSNRNDNGSLNYCAVFIVDINGAKKPNTVGRDIFEFVLKRNGLYPSGCDNVSLCNKNSTGYACACKVLREGAMNY